MRRHYIQRIGMVLCAFFFSLIGVKLFPLTQPLLLSSLRVFAIASVCSSQPEHTLSLWKEQLLARSLPSESTISVPKEYPELSVPVGMIPLPSTETPVSSTTTAASPIPSIPMEYQGAIIEETMSGQSKTDSSSYGLTQIKNSSNLTDEEVTALLEKEHNLDLTVSGPQVLIYHTHATESFEPYDSTIYDTRNTWRSTEGDENMIAVGAALAASLEAHGIQVIHDHTLHDYPSYNGSYERSAVTVEQYLQQYPSIRVLLDVHRDAIQRDDTLVKPIVEINGQKTAQLMLVVGCDDSGSLGIPTWKENLRFGARLQDQIEQLYPGLCRPLYVTYRKYNQHLSSASLLLEVGSHGNTLSEAIRCAELAGDAIGSYLAAQL